MNFSSSYEHPSDSQSTVSWTETHTSVSHPQPLPRVPRPSHLHQNTCESESLQRSSNKTWNNVLFFFLLYYQFPLVVKCVFHSADVQRACVRLPGGERESSNSEERRGASTHALHGQDRRNAEPLQRWHHCLPMWVTLTELTCTSKMSCKMCKVIHSSALCACMYVCYATESMLYLHEF